MRPKEAQPKIRIRQSVETAYRNALKAPGAFGKALVAPLLLAAGISMANILLGDDESSGASVSSMVLQILPFALLGITWGRFELLGEAPKLLPSNSELRRFLVFSGYLLLFGLLFIAIIFVAVVALAGSVSDYFALGLLIFASCLIASWPLARFSLVLPATAIDQRLGLGDSWRLSVGNGTRLFAALLLAGLPALVIFGLFMIVMIFLTVTGAFPAAAVLNQPETVLLWFVISAAANGIQLIGFALAMGLLAGIHQQLYGWQTNRREILERFE